MAHATVMTDDHDRLAYARAEIWPGPLARRSRTSRVPTAATMAITGHHRPSPAITSHGRQRPARC